MNRNFKTILMVLISSCGVTTLTTAMSVVASDNVKQMLFRSLSIDWIIIKEDLESEGDSFSKVIDSNIGNLGVIF